MIFIQQSGYSAIKKGDIGTRQSGYLEYKIINSRNIAAANNHANFHCLSPLLCLPTFFPEFKTVICNRDHNMLINPSEPNIDSGFISSFFVMHISFIK